MATKSKRHIHKYYKSGAGTSLTIWACALPDCTHFMPQHYTHLLRGKYSKCWGTTSDKPCEELVTLDERNMRLEKPLCEECSLMLQFKHERSESHGITGVIRDEVDQIEVIEPTQEYEPVMCGKCKKFPVMRKKDGSYGEMCMTCFIM